MHSAHFDAFRDWHFLRVETLVMTPPRETTAWNRCSPVVASGLLCGSFSHPRDCVVPPVNPPTPPATPPWITSAHSSTTTFHIPSSLGLGAESQQSRLLSSMSGTIAAFQALCFWRGLRSWDPVNIWTWSPFCVHFLIQAEPSGREPGKGWEGKARVNTGNNANGATHNATGKLSQHQLATEWKMEYCFFKWRLKREQCKKSK